MKMHQKSTQNNIVSPNFFVVGAAKSGTTSIYSWLKQHPDVFVPQIKEPSFFVHGYGFSNWDDYLKIFENGQGRQAIGDTSASYLAAPEAPAWIRETLGNIKIVIVLRNPVKRALSLYTWMAMEGYEQYSTFEKALQAEELRYSDEHFYWHNPEYFWDYIYFRSGLYYVQVKRYFDIFGDKNVKIFLFEEIVNTPARVYLDLCNFLEISTDITPTFSHENSSILPRFVGLQYIVRTKFDKAVRKVRPQRFQKYIFPLKDRFFVWNKQIGYKPQMLSETEKKLRQMYKGDVEKLSSLINRDLSEWM
jgi:hypothetical protein